MQSAFGQTGTDCWAMSRHLQGADTHLRLLGSPVARCKGQPRLRAAVPHQEAPPLQLLYAAVQLTHQKGLPAGCICRS